MKMSPRKGLIIASVILSLVCIYFVQPLPSRSILLSRVKVPPAWWNFYEDTKLRYFTPSEAYSGTIAAINLTKGEFLVMITPTCGFPITIEPAKEAPFRDQRFKVNDSVTVWLGSRLSSSRNYSQYYLRDIALNRDDQIAKNREARLQPVILYLDAFLKDHNQTLPTQDEFRAGTAAMNELLILRNRTHAYARMKGAKTTTDYMVGIGRENWYHYYKSWDRSFLNGCDERF